MKQIRRCLAVILALTLLLSSCVPPQPTGEDVPKYAALYYRPQDVYGYSDLTEDQAMAYDTIAQAIDDILSGAFPDTGQWNFEREIAYRDYQTAYSLFRSNFGLLSRVGSCLYFATTAGDGNRMTALTCNPSDYLDASLELYRENVDAANALLASLDLSGSEREQALAIAEWLVDNVKYDSNTADLDSVHGVLVGRTGVCDGFAWTYDFLCKKAGLDTLFVNVHHEGFQHAWNMIRLDGKWYHVDITWMNTAAPDAGYRDYFLFSDEQRNAFYGIPDGVVSYYWSYDSDPCELVLPPSADAEYPLA